MLNGSHTTITDDHLFDLITESKRIVSKSPRNGYREEGRHRRCELELQSVDQDDSLFVVFVRQNIEYGENFSIGLRCRVGTASSRLVTLIRYNGPHGETSRSPDGHFAVPHIHRLTAHELARGSTEPQERVREFTTRYGTFEHAISVFLDDIGVTNSLDFFPSLGQLRFVL